MLSEKPLRSMTITCTSTTDRRTFLPHCLRNEQDRTTLYRRFVHFNNAVYLTLPHDSVSRTRCTLCSILFLHYCSFDKNHTLFYVFLKTSSELSQVFPDSSFLYCGIKRPYSQNSSFTHVFTESNSTEPLNLSSLSVRI